LEQADASAVLPVALRDATQADGVWIPIEERGLTGFGEVIDHFMPDG
jgi:hypothetical protein